MPPTRRRFLSRVLAAASAPRLLAARRCQAFSANDQIRICLIGAGLTGSSLATHFTEQGCELVSVCDPDLARADRVAASHKAAVFADFRKMLDKRAADIDACVIATPTHWNAVCAAISQDLGKHVYLETPMTHDLRELTTLRSLARRRRCLLYCGTRLRSDQVAAALAQEIRELVGEVHLVRAWTSLRRPNLPDERREPPPNIDFDLWLGPAPRHSFDSRRFHYNWRWYWDYGTGFLGDEGTHLLDLVCWFLQLRAPQLLKISAASAFFGPKGPIETPDTAVLNYAIGPLKIIWQHRAWLSDNQRSPGNYGVTFYGERATVHFSEGRCSVLEPEPSTLVRFNDRARTPPSALPTLIPADQHVATFLRSIRGGEQPASLLEDTYLGSTLMHVGNAAIRAMQAERPELGEHSFGFERMSFDSPRLNAFLGREYRSGFGFNGFG